jgi:hypothetical protein
MPEDGLSGTPPIATIAVTNTTIHPRVLVEEGKDTLLPCFYGSKAIGEPLNLAYLWGDTTGLASPPAALIEFVQ